MDIFILRHNGGYLGAFRRAEDAQRAAYTRAVDRGELAEGAEHTWESDEDPRPGHAGLWMWVGEYCLAYEVRQDRLR